MSNDIVSQSQKPAFAEIPSLRNEQAARVWADETIAIINERPGLNHMRCIRTLEELIKHDWAEGMMALVVADKSKQIQWKSEVANDDLLTLAACKGAPNIVKALTQDKKTMKLINDYSLDLAMTNALTHAKNGNVSDETLKDLADAISVVKKMNKKHRWRIFLAIEDQQRHDLSLRAGMDNHLDVLFQQLIQTSTTIISKSNSLKNDNEEDQDIEALIDALLTSLNGATIPKEVTRKAQTLTLFAISQKQHVADTWVQQLDSVLKTAEGRRMMPTLASLHKMQQLSSNIQTPIEQTPRRPNKI